MPLIHAGLLGALLIWSLLLRGWFATLEPTHWGVYDERFGVRNIARILNTGSMAPENGFHPSLSYLPALPFLALSQAYWKSSGNEHFRVLQPGQGAAIGRQGLADGLDFTRHGYRLARWVNCLLGTATIFLTYIVARRIYGFRIAIIAAFLLAAAPWHLRQSGVFKPDIILVATTVLAFWCSVMAIERGTWVRFAVAGGAIGLALSAKFNAIPVIVPLVVAVLVQAARDRSLVRKLVLAGVVSIGVFLLLNPFVISEFWLFRHDFSATLRLYGRKAEAGDMNIVKTVLEPFRWLVHGVYHGRLVGALAIMGIALQLRTVLSATSSRLIRMRTVMLVSFLCGYIAVYSLGSQNPEAWHNWLVLIPFTAIAAAMTINSALEWVATSVPGRRAGWMTAAFTTTLILAFPAFAVHRFAYDGVVPTTEQKARDFFRDRWHDVSQRLVYQEKELAPIMAGWKRQRRFVVAEVDRLSRLRARKLNLADGEVFPASRLGEQDGDFYRRRMMTHAPGTVEINGGWFKAQGEDLVVLEHGWRRWGSAKDLVLKATGREREFAGNLPNPSHKRGIGSLELWLERGAKTRGVLTVGGAATELIPSQLSTTHILYLTPRFRIPANRVQQISVRLPGKIEPEHPTVAVRLHRWRLRTPTE